jgi:hypothetical protein
MPRVRICGASRLVYGILHKPEVLYGCPFDFTKLDVSQARICV